MIKVKGLSGGYGTKDVIREISFSVNSGEFFGILGPNGSGKSTLIRLLAGVLSPRQGEILVRNRSIQAYSRKELARFMAVLPQEGHLPFAYTVEDVLMMGRHPHHMGILPLPTKEDHERVEEILHSFSLTEMRNQPFMNLSGGQKQRVLLARTLVQEPEIILLDEPINHLDLKHQIEIMDSLKSWQRERKLTIVAVLHDMNMASLYCDRFLLINQNGEIAAFGDPISDLTLERIVEVFRAPILEYDHPVQPKKQYTILPKKDESKNDADQEIIQIEHMENEIRIKSLIPLKSITIAHDVGEQGWRETFTYPTESGAKITRSSLNSLNVENTLIMMRTSSTIYSLLIILGELDEMDQMRLYMLLQEAWLEFSYECKNSATINILTISSTQIGDRLLLKFPSSHKEEYKDLLRKYSSQKVR